MNLKKLYLSTAVLIVLAGITYQLKQPGDPAKLDPRVGSTLVANDALDSVVSLELISGTESMTFEYNKDQALWTLRESYQLPADRAQIAELVAQLKDTRLERVASTNPQRIADFGFGIDYINLNAADGSSILSLDLGRETESGKQLIRYGDEAVAFVAENVFTVDGAPVSWLDKSLLQIERDAIRSATFDLANGDTLTVSRESAESDWITAVRLPEGMQLDQGAITRALNRFASPTFNQLAELTDPDVVGAKANSLSIDLTLADQSSYTFTAGRRPEVRISKEVETTNEAGETVTEMQEEVETPAGSVYLHIRSSDADATINTYMSRTAFAVANTLFTSAPASLEALLSAMPEAEPVE